MQDPTSASSTTDLLQNAARFTFTSSSSDEELNEANRPTRQTRRLRPSTEPGNDQDPYITDTAIQVYPSLSHEDLCAVTMTRRDGILSSADSNRRHMLRHGQNTASTSSHDTQLPIGDADEVTARNGDEDEDEDEVEQNSVTVRSSSSNERVDASHKAMQAGQSIGSLSGRFLRASSRDRFPEWSKPGSHGGDDERRLMRTSLTGAPPRVDKVTRSSSTDELTAAGSLQIYDATGTFRIPNGSPRSRRMMRASPTEHGRQARSSQSARDTVSGGSGGVTANRRNSTETLHGTTRSRLDAEGSDDRAVEDDLQGDSADGNGLKRKVYDLRSFSQDKRKLRKPIPVRSTVF